MGSQRILFVGGMLLFLASLAYGLYYDGFLWREQHEVLMYNFDMALNMAVKGDVTMASAFAAEFASQSRAMDLEAHIPGHLALAGAVTAIPLWLTGKLAMSERMKQLLALLIVCGGAVLTTGDFMQTGGVMQLGRYIALAGYCWMMLGLGGYLLYAVLFASSPEASKR